MTPPGSDARTAFDVADRLHLLEPWEVFGERARRYEIHLVGRSTELVRGPLELEGYGIRVFRPRDEGLGIGFQSSTEVSEDGIRTAAADAENLAPRSQFPAKKIDLPGSPAGNGGTVEMCDPKLWDRPMEAVQEFAEALLAPLDGRADVVPSFGSVRATLLETTLANSAGLRASFRHTLIELEFAVRAVGGPEGRPPGEYWINETSRRLAPERALPLIEEMERHARAVREAVPSPTGELPVVLPAPVLSTILPQVIGRRCSGIARLRQMAPEPGTAWGSDLLTLRDEGRWPWGIGSAPVDDEGTPHRRRTILERGKVSELLYDLPHAGAFDTRSTGNGLRGRGTIYLDWRRFLHPPTIASTTLFVEPGSGGSDAELVEAAGDGVWVQQFGSAVPDPLSGAFGGEIRIGYRIRHGKIAEPIRGGTVGGLVVAPPGQRSLIANVAAVGNSPQLCEAIVTPALLIRPLTVAGAS
jgi:TldD protein